MQNIINSKTIGVDLTCLCQTTPSPQQLQIYYTNLLHSVFKQAKDYKFVLFISDLSLSTTLDNHFQSKNITYAMAGDERVSNLDLYFMLDQLTVLPGRMPPLLTSLRTVPNSMLIHNLIPLAGDCLKKWPDQVSFFYRHALEMIVASATGIFIPGQIEGQLLRQLSVPSFQILPSVGAIPFSFASDELRWTSLKSKLNIKNDFIVVPADLIGKQGLESALQFCRAANKNIQVVVPDIRNFVANYLPQNDLFGLDLADLIFEPQLTYFEYLELLSRAACLLITENISATCCISEAYSLQTPVCIIESDGSLIEGDFVRLTSAAELQRLINLGRAKFDSEKLVSDWRKLANQIIETWKEQINRSSK